MKYLVFLSLILSGFSQKIQSNSCEKLFGRQQIVEYTCNATGFSIQWFVEPIVNDGLNLVRFFSTASPGDTISVGSIVSTLVSVEPLISRIRIPSINSLPTAVVVCRGESDTNVSYVRDDYIPLDPFKATILNHTMDSKSVTIAGGINERFVTLNMEPLSAERTDVECFSITNSQNNEVIEMEPTESSIMIVLLPGTVTFNITTVYECQFLSDPVQYILVVEDSNECVTLVIFIWPVLEFLIIIGLIIALPVVWYISREMQIAKKEDVFPLAEKNSTQLDKIRDIVNRTPQSEVKKGRDDGKNDISEEVAVAKIKKIFEAMNTNENV